MRALRQNVIALGGKAARGEGGILPPQRTLLAPSRSPCPIPVLAPYTLTASSYLSDLNIGPLGGWTLGVGVLGIGLGALIAYLLVRSRELARMQRHHDAQLEIGAARPLSSGAARVVEGIVDVDGTDDVAVRLDIVQEVSNRQEKSRRWHVWQEVSRSVTIEPFYLVRDDGQSVYVEPSESALVVDALETSYPREMREKRIRSVDIRRGERFFAYGELVEGMHPRSQQGYRGGSGWILRPPRAGRMLFATSAIRARYVDRARFLRKAGTWLLFFFVLGHGSFTAPFVLSAFFGTPTLAHVTSATTYTTRNKNTTTTHYELAAREDDGFTLIDTVDELVYVEAKGARERGDDVTVPLRRTWSWGAASFFGGQPQFMLLWLVFAFLAVIVALPLLAYFYAATVAWYDRRKLSEYGAPNYWVETRPRRPIDPRAT